jgi:1-deoxy-D-xylulose-5-phosphate synthase
LLADHRIFDVRITRLGVADEFVEHATQKELRRLHGIDREGIIKAARQMMNGWNDGSQSPAR